MADAESSFAGALMGKRYLVVSDRVTFAVTGAETAGAYSVFETSTRPRGGPPMPHAHPQQETLYIVEGEYLIATMPGGVWRTMRLGPGGIAHIAAGVPHALDNVGSTPGKLLAILSPAGIEHFFAEVGVPVVDWEAPPHLSGPPDLEQITAIMAKYRMILVASPFHGPEED